MSHTKKHLHLQSTIKNNCRIWVGRLTFGRSLSLLQSRRSSSKLLAYRIMSSGTELREQCRLSTYSTCRLHPLKMGMHLNILPQNSSTQNFHCTARIFWMDSGSGFLFVHFLGGVQTTAPRHNNATDDHGYSRLLTDFLTDFPSVGGGII